MRHSARSFRLKSCKLHKLNPPALLRKTAAAKGRIFSMSGFEKSRQNLGRDRDIKAAATADAILVRRAFSNPLLVRSKLL